MTVADDGTVELAAELGAAVAARLLALEARVAELEAQRPRIMAVGGGLLDYAD